eukprot:scaffold344_cov132-Skeletonema_menzelii.AAC.10
MASTTATFPRRLAESGGLSEPARPFDLRSLNERSLALAPRWLIDLLLSVVVVIALLSFMSNQEAST